MHNIVHIFCVRCTRILKHFVLNSIKHILEKSKIYGVYYSAFIKNGIKIVKNYYYPLIFQQYFFKNF